jgi:putative beta barrel porin BBP7
VRMAVEQMILRLLGVSLLVALCGMAGSRGVMASEYEFAPPEALDLAEGLDSHQPFQTPDRSHWNLSDISATVESVPASSCCAKCGGGACCPPTWYWEENLRVLNRSRPEGIPLALILTPEVFIVPNDPWSPPQSDAERLTTTLMSNRSQSFDIAAGYDTTVGHYLGRDAENRDQFIEFTFWGMNEWNDNQQVNALRSIHQGFQNGIFRSYTYGDLFSLFPPEVGGFNRVETYSSYFNSDINNFELNVRFRPRGRSDRLVLKPSGKWQRECQPGKTLSYLIGFRYLSLDESFGFHSAGRFTDNVLNVTNPVSGDYDILSHNDMFGPQIGADLMFHQCRYSYGVQTKLAPLVNFSDQTSTIVTDASGDPLATFGDINDVRYAKRDDVSLVGEVSILANYRIRKNLVVHAGYHFVWITGLALAAEQIQFQPNAADAINTDGFVFYQGISGGLEWIW